MLLLGGAACMNALTGMDIYAGSMLIPIGVILYTALGGLKVRLSHCTALHSRQPFVTFDPLFTSCM
jgi:hypothetical protein